MHMARALMIGDDDVTSSIESRFVACLPTSSGLETSYVCTRKFDMIHVTNKI